MQVGIMIWNSAQSNEWKITFLFINTLNINKYNLEIKQYKYLQYMLPWVWENLGGKDRVWFKGVVEVWGAGNLG